MLTHRPSAELPRRRRHQVPGDDHLASGRITSHYSAAELSRLIEAAEKVCEREGQWPEMVVLRGALATSSGKVPQRGSVLGRVCRKYLISLAGELGFEPRLAESESPFPILISLGFSPNRGEKHTCSINRLRPFSQPQWQAQLVVANGVAMSNRRLPQRPPLAPPAGADPLNGLDTPEAIEALERAAEELVKESNLEPRELVRGLLADEGDRQVLERGLALIQHNLENGINTLKVQFAEPRNTADARLTARALQRLSKALLIFNEDTGDQTRFADRRQSQPGRADFGREKRSLPYRPDRRGR